MVVGQQSTALTVPITLIKAINETNIATSIDFNTIVNNIIEKYLNLSSLHGKDIYTFAKPSKLRKMKRIRKKQPVERMKIARERIEILFGLAKTNYKTHPERSKRYIELARKIGKRYNVRLTKEQKMSFCKKCNQLLIPKKTCEIKVGSQKKLMEIKCLNCGYVFKKPYVKKI